MRHPDLPDQSIAVPLSESWEPSIDMSFLQDLNVIQKAEIFDRKTIHYSIRFLWMEISDKFCFR
jgi:hypothetical protein